MMKYTVQRPSTSWLEVVVRADNPDHALEIADEMFRDGNYLVMEQTYEIDYKKHWLQSQEGEVSYAN